jgi:hypothetical protein
MVHSLNMPKSVAPMLTHRTVGIGKAARIQTPRSFMYWA